MDIIKLLSSYNIPFYTEGKNVSRGWVNLRCPYPTCNDTSNHLGYNLTKNYFKCWKCGFHTTIETLQLILKLDKSSVIDAIKRFGGTIKYKGAEKDLVVKTKAFKLPTNSEPLQRMHTNYLKHRKFDLKYLQNIWQIVGTGPVSHLDGINFSRRVIAPIIWNGKTVSFTARDVTGKHMLRYISCPKPREIIHHKNILYGYQQDWQQEGICVEGITDVWRLGTRAFATFGIEYTPHQVHEMTRYFKRIFVIYDDEIQAQAKADKLVAELNFRGIFSKKITIVGDPGNLPQKEADYLVKQILS